MKKLRLFDSLKFVFVAVVAIFAFAFAPAHAATLPAGYTELEYLQSTGTQWIDTGYILQSNDVTYEWTAEDLSTMTNTSLFGSEQTEDPKYSGILYGSKTSRSLFVGNRSYAASYRSDSGFHDWVLSLTNDHNATLYKDGTLISNVSFSGDLQKSMSIGVFNNHKSISNQYAKMMLKKFVIKDNNAVAVNLIPARRDSDGVLGMYDLADANPATAFHTNAGTGEFVAGPDVISQIKIATTKYNEQQFAPVKTDLSAAMDAVDDVVTQTMNQAQQIDQIANEKQTRPNEGCTAKYCLLVEDEDGTPHWYPIAGANGVAHNLPAGYTELQYIESTGTQIIDLGLKWTYNISTKTVCEMLASETIALGCVGARNSASIVWGNFSSDSSSNYTCFGDKVNVTFYKNMVDGQFHEWETNNIGFYLDGVKKTDLSGSNNTLVSNDNIGLFGRYDGSGNIERCGHWRIKSHQTYNDGVLIQNLIPCRRKSDSVLGMYDMVSGQFFTNAGTGEFVAGPDM